MSTKEQNRKYYLENREKLREGSRKYYLGNKEKVLKIHSKYRKENKEIISQRGKKYNRANKEKLAKSSRIYNQENKEKLNRQKREYYQKNKTKLNTYSRNHSKEFPERIKSVTVLNRAIIKGTIVRNETCEICDKKCKPDGHHWSYAEINQLNVIWACRGCHQNIHEIGLNEIEDVNTIKNELVKKERINGHISSIEEPVGTLQHNGSN
jgi:hypothetical protein